MGYTKKAIFGVSWMTSFRIFTRLISFLRTLLLARLLDPNQFGLFGIVTLILTFLDMFTETGVEIFLIQQKDGLQKYLNTSWIISILQGILTSAIMLTLALPIGQFFRSSSVIPLIIFASVIPFIRGFINPAEIILQKELRFNSEFLYRSLVFFADSLTSILLVIFTHSVYGLLWGLCAGALLELILSFVVIKPLPKLEFALKQAKEILHKGKWVTLFGISNYFAQQGDNIAVGKILGTGALGIYEMAYKLALLPVSEITDVVSKTTFPVFSKIERDRKRLKKAFLKVTFAITLSCILICSVVFIFPKEIVVILLGKKWMQVSYLLPVLVIYGGLRAIFGSFSSLFLAVGQQKFVAHMTMARATGLVITILPFIYTFGPIGAAYSALFSVVIEIPVIINYTIRVFKK